MATFVGPNTVQTDATLGTPSSGIVAADGSPDGITSIGPGSRQRAMHARTPFTVMHDTVNTYHYVVEGFTMHSKPLIRKLYG